MLEELMAEWHTCFPVISDLAETLLISGINLKYFRC